MVCDVSLVVVARSRRYRVVIRQRERLGRETEKTDKIETDRRRWVCRDKREISRRGKETWKSDGILNEPQAVEHCKTRLPHRSSLSAATIRCAVASSDKRVHPTHTQTQTHYQTHTHTHRHTHMMMTTTTGVDIKRRFLRYPLRIKSISGCINQWTAFLIDDYFHA